jgi:hypothetical protein
MGVLLCCLCVHGVAEPEGTGAKPAFASKFFHHFDWHGSADRPGDVVAIIVRVKVDGNTSRMSAWCATATHRAIVEATGVVFQNSFMRSFGNGSENAF